MPFGYPIATSPGYRPMAMDGGTLTFAFKYANANGKLPTLKDQLANSRAFTLALIAQTPLTVR